jgi:hypothetical protein
MVWTSEDLYAPSLGFSQFLRVSSCTLFGDAEYQSGPHDGRASVPTVQWHATSGEKAGRMG